MMNSLPEPGRSSFTAMKLFARSSQPQGAIESGKAKATGTGTGSLSPTGFEIFVYGNRTGSNPSGTVSGIGKAPMMTGSITGGALSNDSIAAINSPLISKVKELEAKQT